MSNPKYKGQGQPTPDASDGLAGWFGGLLGGSSVPSYKTTTTPPVPPVPTPLPCPPCPPCAPCKPCPDPIQAPANTSHDDESCGDLPVSFDPCGDAEIPVGPGPITIVINPRA